MIGSKRVCHLLSPQHLLNKRPPGLIAPSSTIGFLTTENLPKVNLGQVKVGSNITQNHSPMLWEVISGHYLPHLI